MCHIDRRECNDLIEIYTNYYEIYTIIIYFKLQQLKED